MTETFSFVRIEAPACRPSAIAGGALEPHRYPPGLPSSAAAGRRVWIRAAELRLTGPLMPRVGVQVETRFHGFGRGGFRPSEDFHQVAGRGRPAAGDSLFMSSSSAGSGDVGCGRLP